MIKAIYAAAAAILLAGFVMLAPAFAPQVEARVPTALARSDKLTVTVQAKTAVLPTEVAKAELNCAQQAWPNIDEIKPPLPDAEKWANVESKLHLLQR